MIVEPGYKGPDLGNSGRSAAFLSQNICKRADVDPVDPCVERRDADRRGAKSVTIHELARIEVSPDDEAALESGATVFEAFKQAPGCHAMLLHRSHDEPGCFWVVVAWESAEARRAFRQTADFERRQRVLGGYFAEPPMMGHAITTEAAYNS
jgi:quinol monooxygenase YgiN